MCKRIVSKSRHFGLVVTNASGGGESWFRSLLLGGVIDWSGSIVVAVLDLVSWYRSLLLGGVVYWSDSMVVAFLDGDV